MLFADTGRRARLRYLPGRYEVLVPGDHVVCAVSGQRIALAELRYWNVVTQEAYASAAVAAERLAAG